jgi:hypothetical protein
MKNKFTCVLKFRDQNMPKMYQDEKNVDLAVCTINHWAKQFAGIQSLNVYNPEGDKMCFDNFGNYFFTIQAKDLKSLHIE